MTTITTTLRMLAMRLRTTSMPLADLIPTLQRASDHIDLIAQQRDDAIRHLHAILNQQRTATQSWQSEQEARQWLESIASDPGAADPITAYYTDRANGVHSAKAP